MKYSKRKKFLKEESARVLDSEFCHLFIVVVVKQDKLIETRYLLTKEGTLYFLSKKEDVYKFCNIYYHMYAVDLLSADNTGKGEYTKGGLRTAEWEYTGD